MSTEVAKPAEAAVVKKFEEATVDSIIQKISDFQSSGELVLPPNYIPENAVRSAWLHLLEVVDRDKKPALEVCSKASIANAFLDMVTQGLSVTKKQGYFVVYGTKLSFDPSYFGSITVAKRDSNVKEVNAVVVYEGDEFDYEIDVTNGRKKIIKHVSNLDNVNLDKIKGAYAIVTFNDGTFDTEIMTMPQIRTSWGMGGSKGTSPAHKNFPDRMAAKTVINRALTVLNASADDSAMMPEDDAYTANIKNQIQSKANKQPIAFEDVPHTEVKETPEAKKESAIQPSKEFEKAPETKNEANEKGELKF